MPLTLLPLFRAVLAIIRVAGSHATFTSPNPAATADERGKYHPIGPDGGNQGGWDTMVLHAAKFLKISLLAIHAAELFALLSTATNLPLPLSRFALPIVHLELSVPAIIGSLMMGVGGMLRIASYRAMGTNFTFELAIKKDHALITHGPYSVVRHPSYTGAFITFFGMIISLLGPGGVFESLNLWSIAFMRCWGFASVSAVLYLIGRAMGRMSMEDRALRGEFKEKWVAWSHEVPYKLVPYIY